jgi:hypothetical protein
MSFDLPNYADTTFPEQARLYSADLQMLTQTASLTGTKSGCAVTPQGSPNMTVAVAAGEIYWLNSVVTVTAGNVTITTAHTTQPRIDLICVNSSGTKSAAAGTPAAIPTSPAIPANSVVIAQVFVPANDTTIGATQIKDRRIIVQVPSVIGATTIIRKTANETVTSSTTLQDDNHLFFTMTSNTVYQVKYLLMMTQPTTNNAMKVNWSYPAGASMRFAYGTQFVTNDLGAPPDIGLSISQQPVAYLLEGVVSTVGTAGDFRLRWAQSGSSTNAMTMLTNSYLEYRVLP